MLIYVRTFKGSRPFNNLIHVIVKTKVTGFILIFFSMISIQSQTCCSGGIPISNNLGLDISEKGTIQVGLNYDYNNLNTLNSDTEKLNDDSRLRITHSALLNVGYSITDRFSAEVLFTWVNQRRTISQFGNENTDQTKGVGDAVLLLKYNFPEILGENSAFNIGIGTKIPLGSSTEKNELGIVLNSDLQPGSNSWDMVYYSLLSKNLNFRPSLNVYSKLIYKSSGTNQSYLEELIYKFGNEFQIFLGVSDQFQFFKTLSNPSIALKYRNAKKDSIDGFDIESTGGNWVFLVPNFSINLTTYMSFNTKAELPIYSQVNGTQLTPTFRISSGVMIEIFTKQKEINLNLKS